ncbi:MAG: molybdopterin-dependent oxidoreductase [Candidatus Dormibacterales bacterium]
MAGACGAGLGVGIVFLLRLLVGAQTLPEVTSDGFVRLLPGPIFGMLIDRLQETGRPLFLLSLALVMIVAGAAVGAASAWWTWVGEVNDTGGATRRRGPAWVRVGLPTVALSLITIPLVPLGHDPLTPGTVATVVGDWLLVCLAVDITLSVVLTSRARPAPAAVDPSPQRLSRRVFLVDGLGAASGLATLGVLGFRALTAAPPAVGLNLRQVARPRSGGGPNPTSTVPLSDFGDLSGITPTPDFYVVSKNLLGDPVVAASAWRLRVDGEQPFSLSYAELASEPHVEQEQTLECISNLVGGSLISNGVWRGVPLAGLLERAGVSTGAVEVVFTCVDGYTESLPVDVAMAPSTLVADRLNGAPLPTRHGFPARVLVPGRYGMKNPKWVSRITPSATKYRGYFERQGWNKEALVLTTSRIDYPAAQANLLGGELVPMRGVAYAGDRGISRVEVSLDGGATWRAAMLRPALAAHAWALWIFPWTPQAGSYHLVVRAYDGLGTLQVPSAAGSFPNGAEGYHRVAITVH